MEEMLERMKQAKVQEQMKQAAREMQDGNREQAQCTQSEVINQMLSLYTCLGRCQNAMSRALEREVLEGIERATRELVEASMLEEDISRKLRVHKGLEGREGLIAEQIGPAAALVRESDWTQLVVALGEMGLLTDVIDVEETIVD